MSQPNSPFANIPTDPNQVTLQHIIDLYVAMELPRLCKETQQQLPPLLRRFAAELGGGHRLVASVKKIEIKFWMDANKARLKSAFSRNRVLQAIRRVFSFAVDAEIIVVNPCRRIRTETARSNTRVITPLEFRTLLRGARGNVKRLFLFLRMTGARPGEARAIRWSDVKFDRLDTTVIVLNEHKTAHSSGRPRIIPLPESIVRMLLWMERNRPAQRPTVAMRLYDLLAAGPVRVRKVKEWQFEQRISDWSLNRARRALGLRVVKNGRGWACTYRLHEGIQRPEGRSPEEHVFLNEDGVPWTRYSFCLHFRRLVKRLGLAKSLRAYCMRHGFATEALAGGVPILLVSQCLGHEKIDMVQRHYLHLQDRPQLLCGAVQQAQQHLGLGGEKSKGGNHEPPA